MQGKINYSLRDFNGVNILDLSGTLTTSTSDAFISVVHNLTERASLIVNMENIKFVTSAGLNSLLEVSYYARDRGNRIVLLWPDRNLLDLVDYADAFSHLIFAESPEEGQTKVEFYT